MLGKDPRALAEAQARPHLYDDERILWIERQRVPRITGLRLLASLPGLLLGWLAASMIAATRAPASGSGLALLPATFLLAAAAWLWATIYPPIKAYRGVRSVYAVLTDHRLLWVEVLADGTSRVRHPFRPAIVGPGDLRSIAVRELGGGAGTILMSGEPEVDSNWSRRESATLHPRRARLIVRGDGRTVGEVAALLGRHLAVREPAPRRLVPGSVRERHS